MDLGTVATAFALIFPVELPDKTFVATLVLATRYRPLLVWIGVSAAFVVQCLVAIEDEDLHRSHFWVRDHATEGLRPLEKYIDGMPEIRMIQGALIERAERCDVPVIMNSTLDQAMGEVLDLVLSTADQLARV